MKNQPRNRADGSNRQKSSKRAKPPSFQWHGDDDVLIWGLHAAGAALSNAKRRVLECVVTRNAAQRLDLNPDALPDHTRLVEPRQIDTLLPEGAVHQGVCLRADPLAPMELEELIGEATGPIVILDQVTDPMNVGAVIRSAAAFDVRAVIMQTRKAPPLSGVLAKAAVGAVDHVSEVRVVNIARAIDSLKDNGWWVIGLAGEAEYELEDAMTQDRPGMDMPLAIVLGAEGPGLRPLVAQSCSTLARIPISPNMESLNVSNAAAIAFYEARRAQKGT